VLAIIHGFLFKIYTIAEVSGDQLFPKSDKIDGLISMYKDYWPYNFPEVLKNDFVKKVQTAFKKKFLGEDSSKKRAS